MNQLNEIQTAWIYSTIKQFCQRHKAFTEGGLRAQIFKAEENGLIAAGAIVRNGRRVLIKESAYFEWLESNNKAA